MASRIYTPMWQRLKVHNTVLIDITESNELAVQTKLIRTIRKAMQKEKYNDSNYRALYPNAKLSSTVHNNGKSVLFKLDSGLKSNDISMKELFGETNE